MIFRPLWKAIVWSIHSNLAECSVQRQSLSSPYLKYRLRIDRHASNISTHLDSLKRIRAALEVGLSVKQMYLKSVLVVLRLERFSCGTSNWVRRDSRRRIWAIRPSSLGAWFSGAWHSLKDQEDAAIRILDKSCTALKKLGALEKVPMWNLQFFNFYTLQLNYIRP